MKNDADEINEKSGSGIHQYVFNLEVSKLLGMQFYANKWIDTMVVADYMEGNPKIEIPELMLTYAVEYGV